MTWFSSLVADGWFETRADRRFFVGLLVSGAIASGYASYAVIKAIRAGVRAARQRRERQRSRSTSRSAILLGTHPPTGPHAVALGVGALRAVSSGEPVDQVAYRRPRHQVEADLYAMLLGGQCAESIDEERRNDARQALSRALRALLGGKAQQIGPGLALVEHALDQRNRVGPELWAHALEEYATARCLPFAERAELIALVTDINDAEDQMRLAGIIGAADRIPSLLVNHWAQGVHLVRSAIRAGWLPRRQGEEYLERAGALAVAWYPNWPSLVGALLLPDLLTDDASAADWGSHVARTLLTAPASPLCTLLRPAADAPI